MKAFGGHLPSIAETAARHYRVTVAESDRPSYRGLKIFTSQELHDGVAEICRREFPPGGRVIELGAGTGAMSRHLLDFGLKVTASDLLAENFQAPEISFLKLDLNDPIPGDVGTFDGVVAVELIEHLENPYHFLRQTRRLLVKGGQAIITTPNTASPVSIAMLLRTGNFKWFDDASHQALGHICPLNPSLISRAAEQASLRVEMLTSIVDPFATLGDWPRMRWLARALSKLQPSLLKGDVLIARLRAV